MKKRRRPRARRRQRNVGECQACGAHAKLIPRGRLRVCIECAPQSGEKLEEAHEELVRIKRDEALY